LPRRAGGHTLAVMGAGGQTRIVLCGRLALELSGREVVPPGRQGRLLFAYLAVNRRRQVRRDELIEVLWPERPPADPGEALSALLSRLRRALGEEVLAGRRELGLRLPADAWIDLEAALAAAETAEDALAGSRWRAAWESAGAAVDIARGGFLVGDDAEWVEERRREVEELRLRALEALAAAGSRLGGAELAGAEGAARELVDAAPFRESAHRLLMGALAARGNVAEALRIYDDLRLMLREELGAAPGAEVQALHERLLREGAAPAVEERPPERKLVTVLCAELPEPGEALDPEELRSAAARAHEPLHAMLRGFGGTLEAPRGGIATALFGAPVAHEDDPERAVRAAIAACERGHAARAGVATGEAIVEPGDGAELASGQVFTAAARLCRRAPDGAVLVEDVTFRATRDGVAYEPAGGEWRAQCVRGDRGRARRAAPLVGRERELALLETLHGTVVEERRPRLVTVVGEAGVGKSRLVEELASRVGAGEATVLTGRCLAFGEGTTYWAAREVLWEAAGIALDDSGSAAARKLGALTAEHGLDATTASALAVSAGISLPENELEGASPESVAEEIALAWPRLLSALAARFPVLVTIEDLHWAEEPLLAMLERIVARSEGPIMLLATARPAFAEAHPGWSYRGGMSQLGLEPLTQAQSHELVERLLPVAGTALRERVVGLAEGNPFFTEEIAHHLGEEPEPAAVIPNSVRALLAARIDGLPAAEKSALQHAAVVGRRFWVSALEPNQTGLPLPPLLRRLEERGLLVSRTTSSLPGQRELSFAHGLTREVAYASTPRGARCRTHAAVGGWLERLAGDRRGEFIDLLAYHWEAAADPADADLAWPAESPQREEVRSKAVAALLDAGRAARKRFQTEQALRYASRALGLVGSDAERLAVLELEAASLHAAVRADEALAKYLKALALARETGDAAAVSRLTAGATLLCARYRGAFTRHDWTATVVELVQQGLGEVGEDSVAFETGALLIGRLAAPRWQGLRFGDTSSARRDAERVFQIARAIDSPYLLAAGLHGLYKVVIEEGLGECAQLAERMVEAAEQMRDRVEAHEAIVIASTSFFWAGEFDRAREVADSAIAAAAALSAHHRLHATAVQTACLTAAGRMPELLDATAEVADLVREEGSRTCPYGALALSRRALALFEAQQAPAAAEVFELLLEATPRERAAAYLYRAAEVLRPFVGVDAIRSAMERIDSLPPLDAADETSKLRLELQLAALGGEPARLDPLVAQARRLADTASAPFLVSMADWADAVALARSGAAAEALASARAACAALEGYGEQYTAARLLVDLLPLLDAELAGEAAEEVADRLEAMGALASAAEARLSRRRPALGFP
jgi:DNA-binding SARP family transcriptional activator